MIKTDAQLRKAHERLRALQTERESVTAQYGGSPVPAYLLAQLEEQELVLHDEIREYLQLKEQPLAVSVARLARHPVPIENVGELLAKLRIAAALTQEQLAQRLGWEQANVSRFESATYSSQTIGKIAEYLDALGICLQLIPSMHEDGT